METVEIEVFASGTHTSKEGKTRVWTREDLEEKVNEFNSRQPREKAPATIGHPTHDSEPAYGYASSFAVRDRTDTKGNPVSVIVGRFNAGDFVPAFVDAVKSSFYRERSLGLRNGKIHHIAWLGAVPPAVKGLAPFSFSTVESDHDENWAENVPTSTSTTGTPMTPEEIQAMADAVSKGVADALAPKFKEITDAIAADAAVAAAAGATGNGATGNGGSATGDAGVANHSAGATGNGATGNEELTQALAKIKALEQKNLDDSFSAFLDSVEMKGKVTPAERPAILREMKILNAAEDYDFSEGGVVTKKSPLEDYKARLKTRELESFSEFARNGESVKRDELTARVKSIASAHHKPVTT